MKRTAQRRKTRGAISLAAGICLASIKVAAQARDVDARADTPVSAINSVDFRRDVFPILSQHCARCHSEKKSSGGLSISDRETVLKGGDSGPAIVPGNSSKSLLITLVSGLDPDRVMPAKGERLPTDQIKILRDWIDQGASWDKNAKYQLALTEVHLPSGIGNPIDRLLAPTSNFTKSTPLTQSVMSVLRGALRSISSVSQ